VDGSDRASRGHFAKKTSNFVEINSQSSLLSQIFLQKSPRTSAKSTHTPIFLMGRPVSMGQKQPVTLFSFSTILTFLLKNRELSKFIKNHRKT
jgi:hypothetical protein